FNNVATMFSLLLCLAGLALANVQISSACGVSQVSSGLIVGGDAATQGAWPWQVSIRKDYTIGPGNYHTCGGTLIGSEWVLTANHCFASRNLDPADYEIILGGHLRDTIDATQQSFSIAQVINHEGYDSRTLDNDITLLRLSTPVVYNDYMQAACLPSQDYGEGTVTWITGWGDQEVAEALDDDRLQQVSVPVISTATCNQVDWYNNEVFDSMFCAGLAEGGKDSCQGDSGGPVVVENAAKAYEVIGITSWGYGCADAKNPGVYTRVFVFRDWINANSGL
ncbi:serine protease, partial [Salmonella sp. s54395]|uniref:serine protease n=1 Tax=Salmonella sp. s54395 TaxID=3159664 RepID=UPI00397ECDE4